MAKEGVWPGHNVGRSEKLLALDTGKWLSRKQNDL